MLGLRAGGVPQFDLRTGSISSVIFCLLRPARFLTVQLKVSRQSFGVTEACGFPREASQLLTRPLGHFWGCGGCSFMFGVPAEGSHGLEFVCWHVCWVVICRNLTGGRS